MSGLKVTVVVEPVGDKKATLKLTHTPNEGEADVREVSVGKTPAEIRSEFELQANSKLNVEVTNVVDLVYDPAQMVVTEKESPVEPQSASASTMKAGPEVSARSAPKSPAKEESGAAAANHEASKPRSTHK